MTPAKILFVDDEIELERLVKQRLRKNISAKEFEFIFAHNGKEGLEKLQSDRQIAMVLTDINMPEMDGLTLLDKLRDIDPTVKAVVVSAYGDMKNIRTAMHCGAFDFITKPIDFEDLAITINRTLKYVKEVREKCNQLQQAQLQLIQSEKMSALGQLVAGIAHEINNPVGFIAGNLDGATTAVKDLTHHLRLYQKELSNPSSEILEDAENIDLEYLLDDLPKMLLSMKTGIERICNISNSLRTFSRADRVCVGPANIHEGLNSTLMILQHRLKANEHRPAIQVIKEYGDIPPVKCHLGQLNQVFMNILANAIDSLEELSQGRTFAEIDSHPNIIKIKTQISEDNQNILIKIQDNGQGIPESVKPQIFDYLFTTKSVGKGTGLGLYISRQIVEKNHGGKLSCESVPGEGTELAIAIPIPQN